MISQTIENGFYFPQKKDIKSYPIEAFEFYGKNKFRYVYCDYESGKYGQGTYKFDTKGILILTFEDLKTQKNASTYFMSDTKKDSLEIDLTIIDDSNISLMGASIYVKERDKRYLADMEGRVSIKIPKHPIGITIIAEYFDMKSRKIEIPNINTSIYGYVLVDYYHSFRKYDYEFFKIIQLKKSSFTIRSDMETVTYKKVNKWKMARKVKRYMFVFYREYYRDFFGR